MKSPNAPISAVDKIIETFQGVEGNAGTDGWLVTFDDKVRYWNAISLINMLKGWKAEPHLKAENVVQVYPI